MADNTEATPAVPVLLSQISSVEKAQQYATQASEISKVATQAISFVKKTWSDTETSGTPITAADLNRIEQAISDLNTNITSLQDSLSQIEVSDGHKVHFGTFTDNTGLALIISIDRMQLQVKQNGLYYVDATGTPTAIWGMHP